MTLARISADEYEDFRQFLENACGILLGANKHYLVQSRLGKVVNEAGMASLGELVGRLRRERTGGALREQIVEAMTTNETFWFRDNHPFRIFSGLLLPEYVQHKQRSLRVWSAACSTGQEPYSISMTTQDYLAANPGNTIDVQIMATDISPGVLAEAKAGYYDAMAVSRGLPADIRSRYFEKDSKHREERWQVCEQIRRRVSFRQGNLLAAYTVFGRFDVIFCRNVLIYFSPDSKIDIIRRMADILNPGGYLFLGASEAITQYSDAFELVRCNPGVVYRKK